MADQRDDPSLEFLAAVARGDASRVEEMLREDPERASARSVNGVSVILTALYHGQLEMARLLLERGARPDAFDAAAMGDADAMRNALAVDPGAVNACSRDGWTPLHLAAFFGHPEVAAYLLDLGADIESVSCNSMSVRPLQSALANGREDVARLLVDRGADVNAGAETGFAPLHYCAANDLCGMAGYLLQKGAHPDARNREGKTPLDLAREHGHHDAAALFRGEV